MIKKNIFSIITALIILYLSMANSHTFDNVHINVPYFDKLVHFGMYFGLMSVMILENLKTIKATRILFMLGLIPLSYGIMIEIMQSTLTSTRSGSVFDALADAAGIILSILFWLWIRPVKN
jgi:VanZ family protein